MTPMTVERPLFMALLGIVILAPLPFGSYRPWAWSLLGCLVAVLLAAWAVAVVAGRVRLTAPAPLVAVAGGLFAGVVLWAVVQTMTAAVPADWHHPIWAEAARTLGSDLAGTVSVNVHGTGTALLRLLTYGGVFWLAYQLGRDRHRADLGLKALVVAGLVYAVYGLGAFFAGGDTILWFERTAYRGVVVSTFVNRNSYATYAGLGVLAAAALMLSTFRNRRSAGTFRAALRAVLERGLSGWGAVYIVACAATGMALLQTQSRMGMAAAGVGVAVLLAAALLGGIVTRGRAITGLAAALAVYGVFSLSGKATLERVAGTVDDMRFHAYPLIQQAISDVPLVGTGYGTFADVFPMYTDHTMPWRSVFSLAHSTYLENSVELGLPAAAALVAAMAAVTLGCLIGLRRRRRDQHIPALAVAATALVAVHSLLDFSLQMPGVAVTYAFLLGLGAAQSVSSAARKGEGAA